MDSNAFCYHDKVVLEKNIDRIRYYNNKDLDNINAVGAGYHLDKETGIKSGGLFFFNINQSTEKITFLDNYTQVFDYGILDIKFSKSQLVYSSNSDYSYSITNVNTHHMDKYLINSLSSNQTKGITCNVLTLFQTDNEKCESKLLLGTNDGYYHIIDIEKQSNANTIKAHDYGLFALYQYDNNTFITGSEDRIMKQWDIRTPTKAINVNKTHKESVNSILKLSFDSNLIVTGQYHEKILFIDIRKFDSCVKEVDCAHNTWDIIESKYKGQHILAMSCIYEGVNLYSLSESLDLNNLFTYPIVKDNENDHQSIVYGIDVNNNTTNDRLDLLTCSFYDSKVIYWSYK